GGVADAGHFRCGGTGARAQFRGDVDGAISTGPPAAALAVERVVDAAVEVARDGDLVVVTDRAARGQVPVAIRVHLAIAVDAGTAVEFQVVGVEDGVVEQGHLVEADGTGDVN